LFGLAIDFQGHLQLASLQNASEIGRGIRTSGDALGELIKDGFALPRLIDVGLILSDGFRDTLVDLIEREIRQKHQPQQNANNIKQAGSSHTRDMETSSLQKSQLARGLFCRFLKRAILKIIVMQSNPQPWSRA
jgi:hypothetical protein